MERAVLLYDSECGFCRWSARTVLAWDRPGRLRAVALRHPEADRLLAGMPMDVRMASWHLVTRDGRVYSAGAAAAPLFRLLPVGSPLATLTGAFPKATEAVYRWISRHREVLGRVVGARACSPIRTASPRRPWRDR